MERIHLVIAGLAFVSLSIFLTAFGFAYQGRFYPNIFIGQENVGGKTEQEVLERFQKIYQTIDSDGFRLVFHANGRTRKLIIPASAHGLTVDTVVEYFNIGDWETTIKEAYAYGRSGFFIKNALRQLSLLVARKSFEFPNAVQEEAVRSLLSRELKSFFEKPREAQFSLNKNGRIELLPEKLGERIDESMALAEISKAISLISASSLEFNVEPAVPLITKGDLEPFLEPVQKLANAISLVFSYNGFKWRVSGKNFATWLTLKNKGGDLLEVNKEKLGEFLNKKVSPLIDNPPQNSRFEMKNGNLVEIMPGHEGNIVDVEKTKEKLDEVVEEIQKSFQFKDIALGLASLNTAIVTYNQKTGIISVHIETRKDLPAITKETIHKYEIKNLVGIAKTSFKGSSENRRHNIATGVSKLNGLLIAPGEEFSAVESIGYATEEAGFVKEYVIKENKSIKELGGGLCQIATTLFRLALNAGVPITERQNHRYVVSYYGPGLDATIYGPHPDLKFVNDTDNYLLLQGRVSGDEVIFELYGQKDGRTVIISEPELYDKIPAPPTKYISSTDLPPGTEQCSETPRAGVTAEVTYTVKYPNEKINEQVFKSVYQPWQKICLIGPAIVP